MQESLTDSVKILGLPTSSVKRTFGTFGGTRKISNDL